ncbi:unnamed protein product [Protopolystoma xenopodis]|uniref:Uncharacterized protein n=1 Tax=Protopolystoma xenopodis TaxID=117903 RepID=A0A3S5AQQ1_9PLAT|nr:unnamed protein product [Protopolystoma xenopodis]
MGAANEPASSGGFCFSTNHSALSVSVVRSSNTKLDFVLTSHPTIIKNENTPQMSSLLAIHGDTVEHSNACETSSISKKCRCLSLSLKVSMIFHQVRNRQAYRYPSIIPTFLTEQASLHSHRLRTTCVSLDGLRL